MRLFSRPRYQHLVSPISYFNVLGLKTDPIHSSDCFIESEDKNPLALAMSCIGNIKFFFKKPDTATKEKLDTLWSDVKCLEQSLEKTHLWEELSALYIAAAFFQDEKLQKKASKKLISLINKAGSILDNQRLELLLDCINIGERMGINGIELRKYVARVLGAIETTNHESLFDYAKRLYIFPFGL